MITQAGHVATIAGGTCLRTRVEFFSTARAVTRSSADSTHFQVEGLRLDVHAPASIFEKSRMSLMMVSSASLIADRRDVVRLLGVELRVEQ